MGTPVQIQQQPLPEAQQAASQTQSSQQVGTGTISKVKHILKDVREVLLRLDSSRIRENACDQCVDVVDFSYAFKFLLILNFKKKKTSINLGEFLFILKEVRFLQKLTQTQESI